MPAHSRRASAAHPAHGVSVPDTTGPTVTVTYGDGTSVVHKVDGGVISTKSEDEALHLANIIEGATLLDEE